MKDKYNHNIGNGLVSSFQRDFLEANLIGTKIKGKTVKSISNKYIHTECCSKIPTKMLRVRFETKPNTLSMLNNCTQGDTEADQF